MPAMATTTKQDKARELRRTLYRAAKAEPTGDGRMPAVKDVGEPCAGKPHARSEVAAGGNRNQSATPRGTGRLPPTLQRGAGSHNGCVARESGRAIRSRNDSSHKDRGRDDRR